MALKIKSARFALNTSGTTQDFTISGFGTVKGALVITSKGTAATEFGIDWGMSVGFTDGTRTFTRMTAAYERVTSNDYLGIINSDAEAASEDGKFGFNSFITDGIRIDLDDLPTEGWYVHVTLFGGDDIANLYVNETDMPNLSPFNVTDPGFQADLVFFNTSRLDPATTTLTRNSSLSILGFGVWSRDDATQMCVAQASSGSNPTKANVEVHNAAVALGTFDDAEYHTAVMSAHASGFTMDFAGGSPAGDQGFYMAIEWAVTPSIEIVEITLPASDTDYVETGFTFQPEWGMIGLANTTAINTIDTAGEQTIALMNVEAGQVLSAGGGCLDTTTPNEDASWSKASFFIGDSDGSTVLTDGPLASLDANGWTFDIGGAGGTHDSVARKGWALAIKAAFTGTINTKTLSDGLLMFDGSPIQ